MGGGKRVENEVRKGEYNVSKTLGYHALIKKLDFIIQLSYNFLIKLECFFNRNSPQSMEYLILSLYANRSAAALPLL